jgi:hypothetical protein
MKAELVAVEAIEKAVHPTVKFSLQIDLDPAKEVIVSATGALFLPSDTLLAPLFEVPEHEQFEFPLQASPVPNGAYKPTRRWLRLGGQLSERDLDYIESHREKDRKGDVHLTIHVRVSTLVTTAEPWLAQTIVADKGVPVFAESKNPNGKALLREDPSKGFLLERTVSVDKQHTIPGTTWLHDFAPRLGLGRFAVVEIPVIASPTALGERIDKAVKAADEAEKHLRAGEWDDVCKDLRGVWEAFKGYDFIKKVTIKDGYSEEAAKALDDAFQNLFTLASKFGHVLGKDKQTVLPDLHAQKEDAYLLYLLARSALNLIARKAKRLGLSG